MEGDCALGVDAVERYGEEDLRGNALVGKPIWMDEADFSIIIGVTHQAATAGTHFLQARQTFGDQGFADALALIFRQD